MKIISHLYLRMIAIHLPAKSGSIDRAPIWCPLNSRNLAVEDAKSALASVKMSLYVVNHKLMDQH